MALGRKRNLVHGAPGLYAMLPTICPGLGTMCVPLAVLFDGDFLYKEQQGPQYSSGIPERLKDGNKHWPDPSRCRGCNHGCDQRLQSSPSHPFVHAGHQSGLLRKYSISYPVTPRLWLSLILLPCRRTPSFCCTLTGAMDCKPLGSCGFSGSSWPSVHFRSCAPRFDWMLSERSWA